MELQTTIHDHNYKDVPKIFTEEDIEKLSFALSHPKYYRDDDIGRFCIARNLAIFYLCYHCATRPKEILCVKLSDIDLKKKVLHIPAEGNKLKSGRDVPINDEALLYLVNYIYHLKNQWWNFSEYLFPSLKGERLSTDRWQEILRDARIQSGIYTPRVKTSYCLRHTKATEIYIKSKDPIAVANYLGHKTLESTKVYIHLAHMKSGYMDYLRELSS